MVRPGALPGDVARGDEGIETWLWVSVTYFHPSHDEQLEQLTTKLGNPVSRRPWAVFDLLDAEIAEDDSNDRQLALEAVMGDALESVDLVTAAVGQRRSREDGFIKLTVTVHGSESTGGIHFPAEFLAQVFAQPGEMCINAAGS